MSTRSCSWCNLSLFELKSNFKGNVPTVGSQQLTYLSTVGNGATLDLVKALKITSGSSSRLAQICLKRLFSRLLQKEKSVNKKKGRKEKEGHRQHSLVHSGKILVSLICPVPNCTSECSGKSPHCRIRLSRF